MKKSVQLVSLVVVALLVLLSGCTPAPMPVPTSTRIPPTFTPSPIPTTSGGTTADSISTPFYKIIHEIGDGGFLSEEPCGPPCFLNIIPGVTTETEANTILQGYFDLKDCHHWDERHEGGVHAIQCPRAFAGPSLTVTVGIDFGEHDIVDGLGFTPTKTITVEEVIKRYGEPSAVDILGWGVQNQKTTSVTMKLFFDDIQTVVDLPQQAGMNYKLEPSSQVGGIYYPGNLSFKKIRTMSQPWNGYGEYEGPYWPGP
jgi:hypothetical protein